MRIASGLSYRPLTRVSAKSHPRFNGEEAMRDTAEQLRQLRRELLGGDSVEGAAVCHFLKALFEQRGIKTTHVGETIDVRMTSRGEDTSEAVSRIQITTRTYGPDKRQFMQVLASMPAVEFLPGALDPDQKLLSADAFSIDVSKVPELSYLGPQKFIGRFYYDDAHAGGW